jgi:hypothetical protein
MYYITIDAENTNQLNYYSRNCGHIDTELTMDGLCVLNNEIRKKEQQFNHIINPYTKLDPTLPRIYNVKCPNTDCKTNHESTKEPAEIIYMRYDNSNLKYLYLCVSCDYSWKTNDNK